MYIDPATLQPHLLAALVEQSGLDEARALQVARIYESLRTEAEAKLDSWTRVLDLQEESSALLGKRVNEVIDDGIKFLREYSAVEVQTIEGYNQFEQAFRAFLVAQVGARVAYALVRSVEFNSIGRIRINTRRFNIPVIDQQLEAPSELSLEEQMLYRATWIINAIRFVDYRGLDQEQKSRVDHVSQMDESDLNPDILMELESLLEKSTPQNELWSTNEGREKVARYCQDRVRSEIAKYTATGWPGFDPEDVNFLSSDHDLDDCTRLAIVLRVLAKPAKKALGIHVDQ